MVSITCLSNLPRVHGSEPEWKDVGTQNCTIAEPDLFALYELQPAGKARTLHEFLVPSRKDPENHLFTGFIAVTVMDLPAFLGASYHLWVVIKLGKIHHELPQKGAVMHGIPFPGSAPVLHVSGIKREMEQLHQ